MTDTPEQASTNLVVPEPDTRLAQLLHEYTELKPAADDAVARLRSVTDAIKAETMALDSEARRFRLTIDGVADLQLTYTESMRFDSKRLKAEDPLTYVRYAYKTGSWTLKRAES